MLLKIIMLQNKLLYKQKFTNSNMEKEKMSTKELRIRAIAMSYYSRPDVTMLHVNILS